MELEKFLKKFDKEKYGNLEFQLLDFSLDFNHELLKENDFACFLNIFDDYIGIIFEENGYFYEATFDFYDCYSEDLVLENFNFNCLIDWDESTGEEFDINSDVYKKLITITEAYIDNILNYKKFRLKFLFNDFLNDSFYEYFDENKNENHGTF